MVLILTTLALLAAALAIVTEWRRGVRLRLPIGAILPATFVVLTGAQIIPLPAWLADRLDPRAAALLVDGGGGVAGAWRPLSLDPRSTLEAFVRSVSALLVFVTAYHYAAKRNGRSWVLRAIPLAGAVAVVIGLGHSIFAIPRIYGLFTNGRQFALLTGPFINANHNAEFLELAAFVALACARQATLPLNRTGWLAVAVVCAAGALATLSRASVFALGIGVLVVAVGRKLERPDDVRGLRRATWLPIAAGVAAVAMFAGSIGASQLLDRFRVHAVGSDLRLQLWHDSLSVLRAHPLGIGRGAFDVVYPVYRSLEVGRPVRFSFVENHPLQTLIDFGIGGFAILVCAAVLFCYVLVKRRRGDGVEMALLGALLAVIGHSLTDFGLETLGVLLPFMAVMGTVMGRIHRPAQTDTKKTDTRVPGALPKTRIGPVRPSDHLSLLAVTPVAITLALGIGSLCALAFADHRNFEAELLGSKDPKKRQTIIAAARETHPFDYYYPLVLSTIEALGPTTGGHSPRLRALNQALHLCSKCPEVHLQVARTLWTLGRRSQALAEWHTAVSRQKALFEQSLDELRQLGAQTAELARLAENNPARLLYVARFVMGTAPPQEVEALLSAASNAGAPALETTLLRGRMKLLAGDSNGAEESVATAKTLDENDPRVSLISAELLLRKGGKDAATQALSVIEQGLDRNPGDIDLQRQRLTLVSKFERWRIADRAINGLKQALQEAGQSTVEANLSAAGIYMRVGRIRDAISEYRIATGSDPGNVSIWRQFGSTAEATGHFVLAREAFAQVLELVPSDKEAREALRRIEESSSAERAPRRP